ncbi:hypothetical protein BDK51DRAFT_38938 [Blyttiomyces helicus]|uniref:Response regulatory domain-containing protein n=1 Tax=Blyttiomyces helicus TaxID=388810 RepID=A0A4P9W6Y9_9FUNG|nr:hypothetical protein BDK51DRAFT_38938 [Blyttiomyces helicus]|eukprot:RKO87802.1 hypothetical protein BDK51DRAFT_38938 [Blyttiomyces helicus]
MSYGVTAETVVPIPRDSEATQWDGGTGANERKLVLQRRSSSASVSLRSLGKPSWLRMGGETVAWSAAVFLLALGSRVGSVNGFSLLWLPGGASIAAILRAERPMRVVLVLILIAAIFGARIIDVPALAALLSAALHVVQHLAVAIVLFILVQQRPAGENLQLEAMVVIGSIPAAAAMVDLIVPTIANLDPLDANNESFRTQYVQAFAGDWLGSLVTTVFALSLDADRLGFRSRGRKKHRGRVIFGTIVYALLIFIPFICAYADPSTYLDVGTYCNAPLVVISGIISGQLGLSVAAFLSVVTIYFGSTIAASRTLGDRWSSSPSYVNFFVQMQLTTSIVLSIGYLLVAARGERDQLEDVAIALSEGSEVASSRPADPRATDSGEDIIEIRFVLRYLRDEIKEALRPMLDLMDPGAALREENAPSPTMTPAQPSDLSYLGAIRRSVDTVIEVIDEARDLASLQLGHNLQPNLTSVYLPDLLRTMMSDIGTRVTDHRIRDEDEEIDWSVLPAMSQWVQVDVKRFRQAMHIFVSSVIQVILDCRVLMIGAVYGKWDGGNAGGEGGETLDSHPLLITRSSPYSTVLSPAGAVTEIKMSPPELLKPAPDRTPSVASLPAVPDMLPRGDDATAAPAVDDARDTPPSRQDSLIPLSSYPSSDALSADSPRSARSLPSPPSPPHPQWITPMSIMIVDDSIISRNIMHKMLEKLVPGCRIVEAADGKEAVSLCQSGENFTLIFMDLEVRCYRALTVSGSTRTYTETNCN